MSAREPTCSEFVAFLLAYLEGELDAETRALFERHLEACEGCLDYLASYRRIVRLGREALGSRGAGECVAQEVPEDLVRAVLAARRRI